MDSSSAELISAIHDERLCSVDAPVAHAVCDAIGQRMREVVGKAIESLASIGVEIDAPEIRRAQRHAAELAVPDAETAARCAVHLQTLGYDAWEPTERGAGAAQARFRNVLTLARTTDVTVAIRLRWPAEPSRVPAALRPNQADFAAIDLPAVLWPLYLAVRPLRLLAERVGVRTPAPPVLGPFLSTPDDLVTPLLDLAAVTADDVVADLGCGDGRILVDAVRRTGCRAIGIETDPSLIDAARVRAEAAGVGDRLRLEVGDALTADLSEATVVFVFLPSDAAAKLIERLLTSLPAGTRIIAHEQAAFPHISVEPASSPLIAGQGVTVAHRWVVDH